MSIKDNKQEIARLEAKIADLEDYKKHIPGWEERHAKLVAERGNYFKSIEKKREHLMDAIRECKNDIADAKKKNEIEIPDELKQWWRKYGSGVNFGYGGIRIVWISEDKKWVIITSKGGTAGTGTPMGTGGYYYAPSEHWLACTKLGEYMGRPQNYFGRIEGRLTKERKKELINQIPQFEKELS